MEPLEISILHKQGQKIAEVLLKGYIDSYTSPQIEQALNELVEKGIYELKIDLSDVRYLSTVGAGVLVNTSQRLRKNKGQVVLVNPSDEAKRVLDLLGLPYHK